MNSPAQGLRDHPCSWSSAARALAVHADHRARKPCQPNGQFARAGARRGALRRLRFRSGWERQSPVPDTSDQDQRASCTPLQPWPSSLPVLPAAARWGRPLAAQAVTTGATAASGDASQPGTSWLEDQPEQPAPAAGRRSPAGRIMATFARSRRQYTDQMPHSLRLPQGTIPARGEEVARPATNIPSGGGAAGISQLTRIPAGARYITQRWRPALWRNRSGQPSGSPGGAAAGRPWRSRGHAIADLRVSCR